jgi:hypothetical protein
MGTGGPGLQGAWGSTALGECPHFISGEAGNWVGKTACSVSPAPCQARSDVDRNWLLGFSKKEGGCVLTRALPGRQWEEKPDCRDVCKSKNKTFGPGSVNMSIYF